MTETSLTDLEIAEMSRLCADCTFGPWRLTETNLGCPVIMKNNEIVAQLEFEHGDDADFIVAARQFVPKALSAIAELKAENARLRAKLSFTDGDRLANELPGD